MKTNLMTEIVQDLNKATGATGAELETLSHLMFKMLAAKLGDKEAEAHFARRFDESRAQMASNKCA